MLHVPRSLRLPPSFSVSTSAFKQVRDTASYYPDTVSVQVSPRVRVQFYLGMDRCSMDISVEHLDTIDGYMIVKSWRVDAEYTFSFNSYSSKTTTLTEEAMVLIERTCRPYGWLVDAAQPQKGG